MLTYITAFIFYTLAMIGILLIGFVVYKKTFFVAKNENRGLIKVIDSLQIAPKKMLLVVKIKEERFLIASGVEHTTFLSKLENPPVVEEEIVPEPKKTDNIEEQFKQLYSRSEPVSINPGKKEMIKQLIHDLDKPKSI